MNDEKFSIREIARLANTSVATVSRVINGKASITQETKDRVYAAMKELDFTRFGVDKYLFDNRNDINYEANIRKMEKFFNSFENSEALGGYSVGSFEMKRFSGKKISPSQEYYNWSQGIYLDDLLSHITTYGIESREKYTQDMQAGMREIFR